MRLLAVLTVRNEAAFLLEWLAHHQAVGFTDLLVFSNDCDDGTDTMLDRLQDLGHLTHVRNDGPYEKGIQWTALKNASKHPLVKNADWIMALDIDEFVNIHVGNHTLPDLLAALPDATAIPLTWRLFGNAGAVRFVDKPITSQFFAAAPKVMNFPWRAAMFKTLYKNDGAYRKLGVHRPRDPVDEKLSASRWFDGSGRELEKRFKKQQIFSPFGRDNYALAQLNHYPLGAMESYIVKRDRGRAVHSGDELGMSYWVERNWCLEQDHSIQASEKTRNARLVGLTLDPELARLHQNAVTWRKARFDILMQQEPNRALFGRLLMTPPSRPVPANAARFIFAYGQSGSTPDD